MNKKSYLDKKTLKFIAGLFFLSSLISTFTNGLIVPNNPQAFGAFAVQIISPVLGVWLIYSSRKA